MRRPHAAASFRAQLRALHSRHRAVRCSSSPRCAPISSTASSSRRSFVVSRSKPCRSGRCRCSGFHASSPDPRLAPVLELEDGLVERLVADTGSGEALPLLAFTLRQLWERRRNDQLTVELYERELGSIEGAVATIAEGIVSADLGSLEEKALRAAFLRMARLDDEGRLARRRAVWDELPERCAAGARALRRRTVAGVSHRRWRAACRGRARGAVPSLAPSCAVARRRARAAALSPATDRARAEWLRREQSRGGAAAGSGAGRGGTLARRAGRTISPPTSGRSSPRAPHAVNARSKPYADGGGSWSRARHRARCRARS